MIGIMKRERNQTVLFKIVSSNILFKIIIWGSDHVYYKSAGLEICKMLRKSKLILAMGESLEILLYIHTQCNTHSYKNLFEFLPILWGECL